MQGCCCQMGLLSSTTMLLHEPCQKVGKVIALVAFVADAITIYVTVTTATTNCTNLHFTLWPLDGQNAGLEILDCNPDYR